MRDRYFYRPCPADASLRPGIAWVPATPVTMALAGWFGVRGYRRKWREASNRIENTSTFFFPSGSPSHPPPPLPLSPPFAQDEFHIGMRVRVFHYQTYEGVVRFVGNTVLGLGPWIGVEMDDPVGRYSGSVEGIQYFDCPEGHGIFVPPDGLEPVQVFFFFFFWCVGGDPMCACVVCVGGRCGGLPPVWLQNCPMISIVGVRMS